MFEDIVSSLLSKYLGDYLEGLSKKDLKISLWKGDVELTNLKVKTEALDFLNLPIQVKEGFVGTLTLKIPWKNLGSQPTLVYMDDVYVLACPKSELTYDEEAEKEKEKERKREQLSAIDENELRMQKELSAQQDNSAMARLAAKIIDNFQLRISHVHMRFEDHSSCRNHPFAAGVVLEKLRLYSPSSENQDDGGVLIPGVIKKKVKLSHFGVYWDFDQSAQASTKSTEKLKECMLVAFQQPEEVSSKLACFSPQHFILEPISLHLHAQLDTRPVELRKRPVDEVVEEVAAELGWSNKIDQFKRIMHGYRHIRKDGVRGRTVEEEWALLKKYLDTKYVDQYTGESLEVARQFCSICWDRTNRAKPIAVVDGELDQFMVQLDQKQYRDMLQFVSGLNTQTLRAKYKRYRPAEDPEKDPHGWWRFAIQSVQSNNKQQHRNTGWKHYMHFKKQRAEYIDLYKRKLGAKPPLANDAEGLARLQKLEDRLSIENVLLFRKVATYEMEEEKKLQEELRAKKKKEKKEKSMLSRWFSQKDASDDEEEVSLEWNDDKRNELFAEFNISPNEVAPWEGGRPTDIQAIVDFKIRSVGVVLTNNATSILRCVTEKLASRFVMRKAYQQLWASMGDFYVEDGSNRCQKWPRVLYTEKNAIVNKEKTTVFMPEGLVEDQAVPFFQMAIEMPAMQEDVDLKIRVVSLPVCVVGNVACLMDLAAFFVPELSKLNLYAFGANMSDTFSNYNATKKLKLKVAKEVSTHKITSLDMYFGSIHILLPEDINQDVRDTEMMVCRLGDISIVSNPKRVDVDTKLTEDTIYNTINVDVSKINVLMTNKEENWSRPEVQKEKNLYLVNDFNCNAAIGLSIAPSEPDFATTKVGAKMDVVTIRLERAKYLNLIKYVTGFALNTREIIENSEVDFSSLTAQAKEAASNAMAIRKEDEEKGAADELPSKETAASSKESIQSASEASVQSTSENKASSPSEDKASSSSEDSPKLDLTEYDDSEIRLLQQNKILDIQTYFGGVCVLIEEVSSSNEHTALVESAVRGLEVKVKQRTFDTTVDISLQAIDVKDCLQSAATRKDTYLVVSKGIDSNGVLSKETTSDLFHVHVGVVNKDSPDYLQVASDVMVEVAFGSLSVIAYRPTVYHLLAFIAPERAKEERVAKVRRDSVSSSVSQSAESNSVSLQSRAMDLLHNQAVKMMDRVKPLPKDWLRKQVFVSLTLQSLSVLLNADSGHGILFTSIVGIHVGVGVCPAAISIQGSLKDVCIRDVSRGCGLYPSILEIVDRKEEDVFVDFDVTANTDTRYPRYPGYPLSVRMVARAPSLTLRMRLVDELMRYVMAGPIAEGLALLKLNQEADQRTVDVSLPGPSMATIEEDAQSTCSAVSHTSQGRSVGQSLKQTAVMLGKSFLYMEKKETKLPVELPFLDIVIKNFKIAMPAASDTAEVAIFELGELTLQNKLPVTQDLGQCIRVDESSKKDTLNTVHLQLTDMRATTFIKTGEVISELALLGGINVSVTVVVLTTVGVNARVTKVALAVNEQQMAFVMKCLKGNLEEKAVECQDDLPTKQDPKPVKVEETKLPLETIAEDEPSQFSQLSIPVLSSSETEEEVFGKTIRGEFVFDGISIELLSGCGGHPITQGQLLYENVGKQKESISSVDLGVVQAFLNISPRIISAGCSLSHLAIRDTRIDTPIHEYYRMPLLFGAAAKPAISALVTITNRPASSFDELKSSSEESIPVVKATVYIGTMRLIPTPWLFDIVKIAQGIQERVFGDAKPTNPKEKSVKDVETPAKAAPVKTAVQKKPAVGPQIDADIKVDNPYIFIVEDTRNPDSSSLVLSLSVSTSFAMSPLVDVDASLRIANIRGCRSHPHDDFIPPPSMTDALVPFDLNWNVHAKDNLEYIQATMFTNRDVELRIGILDVKLIMNAIDNLIPQEFLNAEKEKVPKEKAETEKTEAEKVDETEALASPSRTILFKACLNAMSVTVVNDTKAFELPVLLLSLTDLAFSLDMKPNLTTAEASFTIASDYYNAALTVWEPVLEAWTVSAEVEQEPRDRVVQKLTATQDSKQAVELALTRVQINAPSMLNLNVTNAFVNVALQAVSAFKDCHETTQKLGDGYYIGIRNATGLPLHFDIKNDDGIGAILDELKKQRVVDHRDDAVWAGLVDVAFDKAFQTCWVSLHRQAPRIRVYDAIPVLEETVPILCGNDCELRTVEGLFCETCCFVAESNKGGSVAESSNESSIAESNTETSVAMYLENNQEVSLWREAWRKTCSESAPEQVVRSMSVTVGESSLLVTSLPAHPSLSLKFLKHPYRKLQPRVLTFTVEGYPSFDFQVDRATAAFVPLRAEGLPERNVVVETVVERGRKILSIASRVCVLNECEDAVWYGFGKNINESEIAYAEVTTEELQHGEKRWVEVDEEKGSALFLSTSDDLVRCRSLESLCVEGVHMVLNVSSPTQPKYVNVTVEKTDVPSVFDPACSLSTYTVVLTDVIHLENLLPVVLEYRVLNRHNESLEEGTIKEGGIVALNCRPFVKEDPHRLSMRVKDSDYPFPPFADAVDPLTKDGVLHLFNKFKELNLNVPYIITRNARHSVFIQLFCDYWVINKTGDELILQDGKSKEFTTTLPSHLLVLKRESETVCAKEELLKPTLFSVHKKEKNETARLSVAGYSTFSDSFSINTLGVSGTVMVAGSGHKPDRVYSIRITRAPGLFARSLVLTITPTYIVMNNTGITVKMRQVNCDESLVLESGGYQAFHWTSHTADHKVQLYLEGKEYEWSEGVDLVPNHYSLQLRKRRSDKRYLPWERENLEDPVEHEWSIVQMDVTYVDSQCYVFIKKMDPMYLPFCVTNNTVLDVFTILQEGASYDTALRISPLTSRLYTLPLANKPPMLSIYSHPLDALTNRTAFVSQLTADVSKPGPLGTIRLKNSNRTISVHLEVQKSMKVLFFDEVPRKSLFTLAKKNVARNQLHYLIERRRELVDMATEVDNMIDSKTKELTTFVQEQEASGSGIPPTARATYLQFLCGVDTSLGSGRVMRAKVDFKAGSNWTETGMNRGKVVYWNIHKVLDEENEVEMRMEVRGDLQRSVVGIARLRLEDYTERDCMYDLVLPFYDDNAVCIGKAVLRFVNTSVPEMAEAAFLREDLYKRKVEIEQTMQRLYDEIYVEKTLGRTQRMDRSLSRASMTGVYRSRSSSSVASPSPRQLSSKCLSSDQFSVMDGDESTDELERNLSYCITVHSLNKIPIPVAELQGVYVTASIGSSQLRLPAAATVAKDDPYPQEDVVFTCASSDLGFELQQKGNSVQVSRVVVGSAAERCGLCVGHILSDVNGEGTPRSVDTVLSKLDGGEETTLSFVAPPIHEFSKIIYEQQLLFPPGATVGQNTMTFVVYREQNGKEDEKMAEMVLPISREADSETNMWMAWPMACLMSTSWNSFDIAEELVSMTLNVFVKGIGMSIVDSDPMELLYVSLNKLQMSVLLNENGKKSVEVKLNSCQLDNQLLGTKYPVLFGSPIDLQSMNWLHFSAIIQPHPSVLYLQYCSLLVQEMSLSADSRVITELLSYLNDIPFDLLSLSDKSPLLKLNECPEFITPLLVPDSTLNSTSIYAEMLQLQPLLITITNKMDPAYPLTSSLLPSIPLLIPLQALIDTFGTLVGNVDHAQIRLNSYQSENLLISTQDLQERLKLHYTKQFLSQLYKILGSFNFLGNPVGLLENLGSGVKAFFYEPIQGLVRSPLEFVGGIGKGTKALVMNTTYGVFNAVSKITGTLGDGLSSLTMSEDYQNGRAAGKGGIWYGVKEGVTGVYKDTKKGAESGFFGFVKGAGKGVAGLVLKPVAGVVDQTTKLMEGVKGATKIEKTVNRSRPPRYIYKDGVLTVYEEYLALGQVLLSQCKGSSEVPIDEEYVFHVILSDTNTLIIGTSRLMWVDSRKKQVTQVAKFKYMMAMHVNQRCVTFDMAKGAQPTLVVSERVAVVLPTLEKAIVGKRWQSVTNLVVRLLLVLGYKVTEEDKLLAEAEPLGEEQARPVPVMDKQVSKAVLTSISQATISDVEVTSYHEGREAGKLVPLTNSTYTEYEITVKSEEAGLTWVVFRRFTHFKGLVDHLKEMYPAASSLKLPLKQVKLFQTKNSMDKRKEDLTTLLREVVRCPELLNDKNTVVFLKQDYVSMKSMQ